MCPRCVYIGVTAMKALQFFVERLRERRRRGKAHLLKFLSDQRVIWTLRRLNLLPIRKVLYRG